MSWSPTAFCLSWMKSPLVSQPDVMQTSLPVFMPWARKSSVLPGPLAYQRETSQLRYLSWILIPTSWMWGPSHFLSLPPPISLNVVSSLTISLVIKILFSKFSVGFQRWFLSNLVVILACLWEDVNTKSPTLPSWLESNILVLREFMLQRSVSLQRRKIWRFT